MIHYPSCRSDRANHVSRRHAQSCLCVKRNTDCLSRSFIVDLIKATVDTEQEQQYTYWPTTLPTCRTLLVRFNMSPSDLELTSNGYMVGMSKIIQFLDNLSPQARISVVNLYFYCPELSPAMVVRMTSSPQHHMAC